MKENSGADKPNLWVLKPEQICFFAKQFGM